MNASSTFPRAVVAAVALCGLLSGCGGQTPPRPSSVMPSQPEVKSYTPFPTSVALAQTEAGGYYFFSAVTKVSLRLSPDGSTKFDQIQDSLSSALTADPKCPQRPVSIDDRAPFRRKAELYLRPTGALSAPVSVSVGKAKLPVINSGRCQALSQSGQLVLLDYPTDGTRIVVTSGKKAQRFTIPEGFMPFVLVRYAAGARIPSPMRLDTITIDPVAERVMLVYRTTFRADEPIGKVEFRAVQPDRQLSAYNGQPLEKVLARAHATRSFLKSCEVPKTPGELCVRSDTRVPGELF